MKIGFRVQSIVETLNVLIRRSAVSFCGFTIKAHQYCSEYQYEESCLLFDFTVLQKHVQYYCKDPASCMEQKLYSTNINAKFSFSLSLLASTLVTKLLADALMPHICVQY